MQHNMPVVDLDMSGYAGDKVKFKDVSSTFFVPTFVPTFVTNIDVVENELLTH